MHASSISVIGVHVHIYDFKSSNSTLYGCAARKVWNVCHYYFILHESLVYEWRWFYYREIEYVVMDDKLMEIF